MSDNLDTFICPTNVIIGESKYLELTGVLKNLSCTSLGVVVDPFLAEGDYFLRIRDLLDSAKVRYVTFKDLEPNPTIAQVDAAFGIFRKEGVDALLAVGGGSTIDVAKAVGILLTNGGHIRDYEGIEKYKLPPRPLVAIPTTAGTGSEVSGSCVITDVERNKKMSIRHGTFNPARVAILDPLAVATVPTGVAVHSGIDAFVHAFESFISKRANLITDALNIRAITLISGNLRQFVANPSNTAAATATQCGATMAGISFGQTGLGNAHCLARFIGAEFHLPHGLSNAVVLREVARFNRNANPAKFAQVATAMGVDVGRMSVLDAADSAVEAIDRLCRDLGVTGHLSEYGASDAKFEEIAELCVGANYDRWNPRRTTKGDFLKILEASL